MERPPEPFAELVAAGAWQELTRVRLVAKIADSTDLRTFLEAEMRARNWTQRLLAARSGVHHSTISRLLRQNRSPSLATVNRLCTALAGARPPSPQGPSDLARSVKAVASILASDPQMDRARAAEVLDLYLRLRSRGPIAVEATPIASVRKVNDLRDRLPRAQ